MKALIVDDEEHNRFLLKSMLNNHCKEIEVIGDADCAESAYTKINTLKPDLVFLDIKMPNKNGFELLSLFSSINFYVIFVTGFDDYAIKAFEFNAIDYLLKPIDYIKLINAVQKCVLKNEKEQKDDVLHFIHSINEKSDTIKRISIHGNDKVKIIDVNDIMYIKANSGYANVFTKDEIQHHSCKTLLEYETLFKPLSNFIKVSKSYLLNIDYVDSYTKGISCLLTLKNNNNIIEVSRRKKSEIINFFKSYRQ